MGARTEKILARTCQGGSATGALAIIVVRSLDWGSSAWLWAGIFTFLMAVGGLAASVKRELRLERQVLQERDRACQAVVRFLATSCFINANVGGDEVAEQVPAFRVTAFCSEDGEILRAKWRAYWREAVEPAVSAVEFRKGHALAGAAWVTEAQEILKRDNLPSLQDLQGNHNEWHAAWVKAGIPVAIVSAMGSDDRRYFKYIEHVRSVLCVRMTLGEHQTVIGIDSPYRHAFDRPDHLTLYDSIQETIKLAEEVGKSAVQS